MSAPEQKIEVGQTWERIRDGVRVVVTKYHGLWDDVRYQRVGSSRHQAIYGSYLRARYRLMSEADQ